MSEVAKQDEQQQPIAPTGDSTTALINMVERASTNPDVDVEKLERLWKMYDAERNRQSEQAFNAALSRMQAQMPAIPEGGKIVHSGRTISTYGRWDEDIMPVIRPILRGHGFGLRFHTDTGDKVKVEAVLSHEGGHSERTTITLAPDNSGSKSGPQAVASSVSYGKRYTAASLLNLEIHGQDDDAQAASGPERVSQKQAKEIDRLLKERKVNGQKFLEYFKITRPEDLAAQAYDDAVAMLKQKPMKDSTNGTTE